MAAPLVQSNSATASASSTTITVSLTGVTAGALIVLFASCESGSATISVSDGTNSLTGLTQLFHADGWTSQQFYLESSSSGNKTYTVTFSGSVGSRGVHVHEYPSGYEFQAANQATNAGSSSFSSGNVTTGGTDIVVGGVISFTASTSNVILGTAATNTVSTSGDFPMTTADREASGTGAYTGTFGFSIGYSAHVATFAETAAGTGPARLTSGGVIRGGILRGGRLTA